MSSDDTRAQAQRGGSAYAIWRRLAAADRPVFWVIAAAVFLVNAVLSTMNGAWILGGMQAVTGLLALISASTVAASRRRDADHVASEMQDATHASTAPSQRRDDEPDAFQR